MNALLPTLLGAVLAPTLLGAGLVRTLGLHPRESRRAFVAWAYLCGHFALAWATFAWAAVGRAVPGPLLPVVAACVGAALWWRAARRDMQATTPRVAGDRWVVGATTALVALALERGSFRNLHAVLDSDEANIWSAKARLLVAPGTWEPWFATGYVQHPDYPLFDPLVQVLAFASSGETLWWEHRLPMQLFGAALLLLLSAALERRTHRFVAIAVLAATATSTFVVIATTVYADVLLALGVLATVDAWTRWRQTGRDVWWRLGCVGLAAMLATKNEGAMLALAVVAAGIAAALVARERLARPSKRQLAWLFVPVATLAAGTWFNATFALSNDLTAAQDGRGLLGRVLFWFPERIGTVLEHYATLALDGSTTRWLFAAALLAPLAAGARARRLDAAWPWLTAVLGLAGYVLVFVGTTANHGGPDGPMLGLVWHLGTAADRTLLHVLPTAGLAVAAMLGRRPGDALD